MENFPGIWNDESMTTLIEKFNEYQISMVLIFIDFEKAFDSVENIVDIGLIRRMHSRLKVLQHSSLRRV